MTTDKSISIWLILCCVCVLAMVVVGGITRLTESGLSIVEWQPVTGALPPMNEQEWLKEFTKYKTSPQYQKVNVGMALADFKQIYMWEFIHRLIGRVTGVIFALPFIFFAATRKIRGKELAKLGGVFALGGAQGLVGWMMVKSGLRDNPYVSHYMLTFHLGTALIILALLFAFAIKYMNLKPVAEESSKTYGLHAYALSGLIFFQCLLGGLMAGLRAGLVADTFPDMNGQLIPEGLFSVYPWFMNFLDNPTMVHFQHRIIAYIVAIAVISFWLRMIRATQVNRDIKIASNMLVALVIMQIILGVLTVTSGVAVHFASQHQALAVLLFATSLFVSIRVKSSASGSSYIIMNENQVAA